MSINYKRLGDIATYINGYAFKPKDWGTKGLPIIRIQNLTGSSKEINFYDGDIDEKYIVRKGDILIAWSASLGVHEWNGEKALLNQHIFKVVFDKEKINKNFFKFMVQKLLERTQKYLHGSTMKHITKKYFDNLLIPFPPLEIQEKTAGTLLLAESLVNKRKAQIEALDQLTQSVFLEMFGDPYKNPKNWPVGTIKDITLKTQYGTSKKASENKGKYPILRMGNITYNGFLDFNDMKYIDLDDSEAEKYLVHKGDLLFNRTNSKELVGKTAVYREELPMAYAGYLVKLVPNEKANSEFISGFLNSKYGKTLLYSMAKNIVGMANINAEELKRIKIYIPPRDLQDKFASIISNILERRELLNKGLKLLEENYNSLMQRAFKGELFTEEKVSNF